MKKNTSIALWSVFAVTGVVACAVSIRFAIPHGAAPSSKAAEVSSLASSRQGAVGSAPLRTADALAEPIFADPAAARRQQEELTRKRAEIHREIETAARLPDSLERAQTLGTLCYRWAEFDPCGAVEIACDHDLDLAPGDILGNLTQQWATADFSAARAWVDAQAPDETRGRLAARIALLLAHRDPAAAADYVIEKIPPGEDQSEAAISVIYQWTRQDPEAAAAWARNFPAGPLRARALHEALAGASSDVGN